MDVPQPVTVGGATINQPNKTALCPCLKHLSLLRGTWEVRWEMAIIILRERLEKLLKERKWTHDRLANHLGLSVSMISQYNTGKSGVSADILYKLADTFDVSMDWLVGRTDDRTLHHPSDDPPLTP